MTWIFPDVYLKLQPPNSTEYFWITFPCVHTTCACKLCIPSDGWGAGGCQQLPGLQAPLQSPELLSSQMPTVRQPGVLLLLPLYPNMARLSPCLSQRHHRHATHSRRTCRTGGRGTRARQGCCLKKGLLLRGRNEWLLHTSQRSPQQWLCCSRQTSLQENSWFLHS